MLRFSLEANQRQEKATESKSDCHGNPLIPAPFDLVIIVSTGLYFFSRLKEILTDLFQQDQRQFNDINFLIMLSEIFLKALIFEELQS